MWYLVRTRVSLRQESQFKYHRPVDSQPWSGRALIIKGNCLFDFNRPDVCLSWSGHKHSRYGNCVFKNCRLDVHPPWSEHDKPYMEITCSGCATVRTSVSHRPDAGLKQERFSAKFLENSVAQLSVRTAQVHHPNGVCTYYSSRPLCTSAYK